MRDVRLHQLPAVRSGTAVATLLVGLNDVARSGFDAAAVRADLLAVVEELSRVADRVVLGRLHDPVRLLPLPERLRRVGRQRVAVVNGAVDEAARLPRVEVLDLAELPALAQPGAWAVDRVHPSPIGHAAMASAAADLLRDTGMAVEHLAVPEAAGGAGRVRRAVWVARHGLPYLAAHVTELGTPAVAGLLRRA